MVLTDERWYSDIANAIRTMNLSTASYTPECMARAILDLPVSTNMTYVADMCAEHKIDDLSVVVGRSASFITSSFLSGNDILTVAKFPKVRTIYESAFHRCSNLTTISFPRCESISSNAFYQCISLSEIDLPHCAAIGSAAFYGCSGLSVARVPIVTSIGSRAFYGCTSLMSLYLMSVPRVPSLYADAFGGTPMLVSQGGVYGSIYVPSSLYGNFITSWPSLSARIASMGEGA